MRNHTRRTWFSGAGDMVLAAERLRVPLEPPVLPASGLMVTVMPVAVADPAAPFTTVTPPALSSTYTLLWIGSTATALEPAVSASVLVLLLPAITSSVPLALATYAVLVSTLMPMAVGPPGEAIVVVALPLAASITTTWPAYSAYTLFVIGLTAITLPPEGAPVGVTVEVITWLLPLITEIELVPLFSAYTVLVTGLIATDTGVLGT